jgi:hypothetical protein
VDESADLTDYVAGGVDGDIEVGSFGHVDAATERGDSGLGCDFGCRCFGLGRVEIPDGDRSPLFSDCLGAGPTDAGCSTGDDNA